MPRRIALPVRLAVALALLLAGSPAADAQGPPLQAPPPPRYQAVPPPPGPPGGSAWRPGYWHWNGRTYVWRNGRYLHAPHPYAAWVPGRWVPRRGRWVWVPGHWR